MTQKKRKEKKKLASKSTEVSILNDNNCFNKTILFGTRIQMSFATSNITLYYVSVVDMARVD